MRGTAVLAAGVLAAGAVGLAASATPPAAAKLPPPTEEQMAASAKNLKEVMLAFHLHRDKHLSFPNDIYSTAGKPLLSWRVLILPHIDQKDLYRQFKLDEPWDGETNKKLLGKMPKLYAPIRVTAKDGMTFYRGFSGKDAVFGPDHGRDGIGLPIEAFGDGTSNTGIVFEAGEPVIWTRPDELAFDPDEKVPKLGGMFDGVFHVGLGDGIVIRCAKNPVEAELRKLIMPNDGYTIDFNKLGAE
jgi:hypothetical protein